jgi:peroxiredoxin Q/BCP
MAVARGPWGGGALRFSCAAHMRTTPEVNAMTTAARLRYNSERRGDAMDVNDKAPEFTLPDQNGEEVSLKGLRGKTVVLYFYPRADTPGCTIEACEFRDSYKKIQKTGVVLLGISPDTPKAQKKFEEKFDLPFTLLGDAVKKVANAYGVMQEKNMYGRKVIGVARTTFVIGPDGKIKHVFKKVKPQGHADEVLEVVKEMAKPAAK